MSETLTFREGDKKWHAFREKAKTDLFWLCSVVLGFPKLFAFEPETHYLPTRFLERKTGIVALDEAPKQLILWPRDVGKSQTGIIGHGIQLALQDPDRAILIANEKEELAAKFLSSIKKHFETNAFLRALFPEIIPPDFNKTTWSATRATLVRENARPQATFEVIGVGGAIAGNHYDIVLTDDLISKEAREAALAGNWSIMDKVTRWVLELEPLMSSAAKPFPWQRYIGTHWFHHDVYERIEEMFGRKEQRQYFNLKATLPSGERIARQCYRVGSLAVMKIAGIEQGRAVYPKIWSMERMLGWRANEPELFAANILNDPSDASITTFNTEWLRYWRRVDNKLLLYELDDGAKRYVDQQKDLLRTLVVDPAFTSTAGSSRAAIVVLGTDTTTGRHLILEASATRQEPSDLVTDIINTALRYDVSRIYIEAAGQQLAFIQYVQAEARARNAMLIVDTVKPGGRNKDVRIEPLSAYFRNGQILAHASQIDLLEEYRKYRPGARSNDLLDALAYAIEKAPVVGKSNTQHSSRQQFAKAGYDRYRKAIGVA